MKYFTIKELSHSDTAERCGIDNTPNSEQVKWLEELVDVLLDPIREKWGKPIKVNSGYRCQQLNNKVGGVSNSHHLCYNGYAAADITCGSKKENTELFNIIKEMNLPLCQCIWEKKGTWIHISYNKDDIRHQYLNL